MGAAENRAKSAGQAAYMKERGIVRRTGQCPICFHTTSIPMDRHFTGRVCMPRRKAVR